MKPRLICPVLIIIVSQVLCASANSPSEPSLYTCVDWDCEDWISKGKTLLTYVGKTDKHLSFKKNVEIYIISKPVDKTQSDWVGKVGNKIGLVPKDYVREDKMNKSPKFKLELHDIPALSAKDDIEENEAGVEEEDDGTEEEEDEEDIQIEDIGDTPSSNEVPIQEQQSVSTSTNEESINASPPTTDILSENAQTSVPPEQIASQPESELPPEPPQSSPPYSDVNVQLTEEMVAKLDISSDPALDAINLQPSTDTVLQGTTTIVEYLAETPKTEQQKPTDAITPRIPETVVLDTIAKIKNTNAVVQSDATAPPVENLVASRVEPSIKEEETQFSASSLDTKSEAPSESTSLVPEPAPPTPENEEEPADAGKEEEVDVDSIPNPEENSETVNQNYQDEPEPPPSVETIFQDIESQFSPPTENMPSLSSAPEDTPIPDIEDKQEQLTASTNEENINATLPTTENLENAQASLPSEGPASDSSLLPELPQLSSDNSIVNDQLPGFLDPPKQTFELRQEEIVPEKVESNAAEKVSLPPQEEHTPETSTSSPEKVSSPPEDQLSGDSSVSTEEDTPPSQEENASENILSNSESENVKPHPLEDHVPKDEVPTTAEDLDPEVSSMPSEASPTEEEKVSDVGSSVPETETEQEHQATETPSTNSNEVTPSRQENSEDEVGSSIPEEVTTAPPEIQLPEALSVSKETAVTPSPEEGFVNVDSNIIENVTPPPEELATPPPVIEEQVETATEATPETKQDHEHDHGHGDHHHHRHHHHHGHRHHFRDINDTEASSIILVIKHLSSTLLSFLPEALQDTILDVDDALVFTGIIALTLVSICVPYFLIEGYMSVRPLKKKVVELNKSLWKVSAAYETQQEEFEIFKQKAIAHDEYKKRAEQSENDVVILKKLETKHREQITALKTQLKSQMKEAVDIRALIEKTLGDKKVVVEECEKYKTAYESAKEALLSAKEELSRVQNQAKSSALLLNTSGKNAGVLTAKINMLEQQAEEMKAQLAAENEKRKHAEIENRKVEESRALVEKELTEFKNICHQYEGTVSGLNDEISKLESELTSIKETLGDDSPLLDIAEVQAKAAFLEKESDSLRTRLEGLTADNDNLTAKLKETTKALEEARGEGEQTNNRLQVLEKYFKEREEEYIKTIEKLELKESVRDKGKEELIRIIEEKDNVCKDLEERLETLKEEFEETKQQHRNEIRALEAKGHENWLSLCQAERKAQDARKEAKLLRQRLTALSKEKDDEDGDGLNGEVPMFPVLPDELVPLPILDDPPSYFGLGDFVPPPPLPEGEPHRPPPLGGLGGRLSPSFSDLDDNILSPIGVGRREDDCTDGSSGSDSPRRSPPLRGNWVNAPHDREGQGRESIRLSRATSSPIQPGANL